MATIASGICTLIGFLFTLFAVLGKSYQSLSNVPTSLGTIGIAIIGLSIYTQPSLLLCIVCELTTARAIQIVFSFSVAMFSIGKILAVSVQNFIEQFYENVDLCLMLWILAPCCLLSFVLAIFINDSPRYFIENNIHRAEDLIKKIVKINGGESNQVLGHIDENFMLKRIHLRRYNFLTLCKFNSFGFPQCKHVSIKIALRLCFCC